MLLTELLAPMCAKDGPRGGGDLPRGPGAGLNMAVKRPTLTSLRRRCGYGDTDSPFHTLVAGGRPNHMSPTRVAS